MRAKRSVVAAYERNEPHALSAALREHPAHAAELADFMMALTATESYMDEPLAPDVVEIGQAARAQAFAAVFGAQPVAQAAPAPAAVSLKALRQARGVALTAAAQAVGLGADVLSALEAGRIRVASVPRRLSAALAELLSATAEQVTAAMSVQVSPALRRGAPGASSEAASQQIEFADAVLLSQGMSQEQKAQWLSEQARGSGHS
jgi:transcriptional regulator with XRE-family HTH domain